MVYYRDISIYVPGLLVNECTVQTAVWNSACTQGLPKQCNANPDIYDIDKYFLKLEIVWNISQEWKDQPKFLIVKLGDY